MLFPFLEKIEEVKKPLIREGTIFAVQFGGKYCFGKVMCMKPGISNISRENFVVCFFNELSDDLYVYPKQISINNLLLGPIFICDYFWKIGVCYSIDYIPLTEEEKELDIGFFCSCKDEKIKIYHFMGQEIFHDPQILTPCIESMLEDLEKELIIELMLRGFFRIEGQV